MAIMKVKPQECLTIDCPRWLMREMLSFGSGFRMCLTDFNRIWKGGDGLAVQEVRL